MSVWEPVPKKQISVTVDMAGDHPLVRPDKRPRSRRINIEKISAPSSWVNCERV